MVSERMLAELVNGLCDIFGNGIYQIILYDSEAGNKATADSDIDIVIILEEALTVGKREKVLSLAVELDTKYERVISIVDIEWKNMEKWENVLPFYKNIKKEGIVLWRTA